MEKLEKVMKGLEACSVGMKCGPGCPYGKIMHLQGESGCLATMARDALELLKAQEPRAMTLEEILTAKKTDCWFEERDEDTIHPLMLVETENSNKSQSAYLWPGIVAPIKGYGKTWRCWTSRPTDEQRKAVKWE